MPFAAAAAFALARETARIALAPNLDLFSVPSRSSITWSTSACALASLPTRASAIGPFTASIALRTPLPRKRDLSPSRSSRASREPVDAPDGAAAIPTKPPSRCTSASTVGLPRESMISRPRTLTILDIECFLLVEYINVKFKGSSTTYATTWIPFYFSNSPRWNSPAALTKPANNG